MNDNENYYGNKLVLEEREGELQARSAQYITKVMGWMCVGLLTTVVAAMAVLASPQLFVAIFGGNGFMVVMVAQLLTVMVLSMAVHKLPSAAATVLFMLYSALTGLTLSVFAVAYELSSLILAFGITAFVFLTMSVYGFVTHKDLTSIGRLALFGLMGIIVAGIANFFLGSTLLDFAITCIGIVVFIGITAYDVQRIKETYIAATVSGEDENGNMLRSLAIYGALTLYLDFINLFLKILRLVGRRRN